MKMSNKVKLVIKLDENNQITLEGSIEEVLKELDDLEKAVQKLEEAKERYWKSQMCMQDRFPNQIKNPKKIKDLKDVEYDFVPNGYFI